jgi:hypothetical protein
MLKYNLLFLSFFITCLTFSQTDSTQTRGTIKIGKPQDAKIDIQAALDITNYDFDNPQLNKLHTDVTKNMLHAPMPVVEGYSSPFDYSKYFNEQFKRKVNDLKGRVSDTVKIEIIVLENGKVYYKDKTPQITVEGVPAFYNEKEGGYELNNLHLYSLDFLKQIETWEPAYVLVSKKTKYKKQTVITPSKIKIKSSGVITIILKKNK